MKNSPQETVGNRMDDRNETEIQLRKLSQAVEQSPASVVITNIHGEIEYVNPKFTQITGYTSEEALGQNPRILSTGEHSAESYINLWATISSGKNWQGEFHNKKKNGELYWESASISPIKNNEGVITHFVAVKEDITERKKSDERLKQSEERAKLQRAAIASIAMSKTTADGDLPTASPVITKMLSETIHVERASIWFFNDDSSELRCMSLYEAGSDKHSSGFSHKVKEFPAYFNAIKSESIIYAHLAQTDPRTVEFAANYLIPIGITSMLDAGIYKKNNLAGVVCLEHIGPPRVWLPDEEAFLSTVSALITRIKANADRRQAEEALNKSHELLTKITRQVPGVVYQYRLYPDGRSCFPFSSPGMMEIYGVTSEEVREDASLVFSRLHPEDVDYIVSSIQESARTQELYHSEYRVILPGQGVRWRLCDANPELLDDGSTLWYGIITDITDRKLAEETIRQSEVRYRSLLTNLDVGVVVHSPDTKITKYNSKAIEILGLSDEQMLGKTAIDPQWSFLDENGEILPLAEFPVNLVVTMKQPLKNKLMGVRRPVDNKIVWISVNGMPVVNVNGELSEIVISFIDITERKQAELAKHIQYNIARSILTADNLDDFLKIIKNELSKLLDTTNFFVALYDPEKDILKKLIYHDQTEDFSEWPANRSLSGQVVKSGKSMLMKRDEIDTFIRENGIELMCTTSACWLGVPITIQNVVSGAMVIHSYTDTNAYNAADQTLLEMVAHEIGIFFERRNMLLDIIEAKEKAEESDKLKTAFIQNISHEIRTPLNGILGFGRLWAEADLSQAEREKYFETVQNSSLRLLNTVTDYMDMALIVSGTMKLNNANFLLTTSLELICETISKQSHEKNIEFETIFPVGHEQICLHSDVELIRKVIKELADNAIKFTKTGKITLGFTVIDGFLKFYLKDTGTGISSEKVTVIFDMFTQEEMAMTRGHEGSGLGLSISKGIVGLLGGKIWLESEKGKGSTFYFTIPYDGLATIAEPVLKREPVASGPGKPMILLAEDDESNYLYFKVILNRAGCDHLHAKNGEEAVALCKQNPDINFVLMDIKMPVMNGLEATKRIREFRTNLPVIALTAYAQTGDEQRILAAGCDEYLPKPIKPDDLKSLIRKYTNADIRKD